MAHTDALTGLANRRMFEMQGLQSFEQARRYSEPLCVILFDIDFFKRINDKYGHAGGDIVLRELGEYLRAAQRGSDTPAARVGGEEFGLLLSKASLQEAARTAERLRQGIEQLAVTMPNGENIHFSVSLGVAESTAADNNPSGLIRRADMALYRAKQNGRNRIELAD
jgi:diguanylate cyclase (GGDEF)-like protein